MKQILLFALCAFSLMFAEAQTIRIELDEGPAGLMNGDVINDGDCFFLDVVTPTANVTDCDGVMYTEMVAAANGVNDVKITANIVTCSVLGWDLAGAEFNSGGVRSDVSMDAGESAPNDTYYVHYTFDFIGDLAGQVSAEGICTRHTSTNGSSELYEWTQVTLNSVPFTEADICTYQNTDYSDLSGSNYFNPDGTVADATMGTGVALPNGVTMSEFLSGMVTGSVAPGGQVQPGWWAVDDFNTTILDGDELPTTNPGAGNGGPDDNQTINGATDIGLPGNTTVNQVNYFFGYTDVAFDTDGDGFTQTNTDPSAGVSYLEVKIPTDAAGCPVPVEFTGFWAEILEGNNVKLSWETATELDNAHFLVERSNDGVKFEELAKIEGAGTTVEPQMYSYLDVNAKNSVHYYRLKQVDFDGTFEYSKIVTVNTSKIGVNTKVFPSPTSDKLNITMEYTTDKIQIMDVTGRVVAQYTFDKVDNAQLDVANLVSGTYFVAVHTERGLEMIRFIKK